jgi:hypothetical protein
MERSSMPGPRPPVGLTHIVLVFVLAAAGANAQAATPVEGPVAQPEPATIPAPSEEPSGAASNPARAMREPGTRLSCDRAGCWDSNRTRYNRSGETDNYWRQPDRAYCQMRGRKLVCENRF